jgi:hypothetical protein
LDLSFVDAEPNWQWADLDGAEAHPLTTGTSALACVGTSNTPKAARKPPPSALSAQSQFRDKRPVALHILFVEVPEESPALTDHHQQPSTAVVVLFVDLEMLGEMVDAFSEQRYLDLRRTGVRSVRAKFINDCLCVVHEDSFLRDRVRGRLPETG